MGEKMAISNEQLKVGQPVVVRGDGLSDGATVQVTEPDTILRQATRDRY